jgi:hypothetical protein
LTPRAPKPRNPHAKEVRQPKYRPRVETDRKKEAKKKGPPTDEPT